MTWLIMTTTLSKIILLTLPLPIFPLSPLIHHRTYPLISSLTPIQCLFPCQVSEVSLLMPRNEHDAFPPSLSSLSHSHIPLLLFVSLIAFLPLMTIMTKSFSFLFFLFSLDSGSSVCKIIF